MANTGFVGMGLMGAPMAGHLLKAGHKVAVWNRTRSKAEPLAAQGARVASSPADAAKGADFVFTCVGDTPDVEEVLFGKAGVAETAAKGSLVVDCSTIAPEAEVDYGARLAKQGVAFLDAPLTGGQKGAIDGTITFMVGGDAAVLERARPLMMAMGKKIIHAGPLGSGQKLKIINQIVCSIHLLALGEGFAAAKALGLDLNMTRDLLISGAAKSWAIEVYGDKILAGDYAPGFPLKWQAKDARIATEAAIALKLELPALELAYERLKEAVAKGMGDFGSHAVARLYDRGD
jgi:3-hydroxyisobutyrate dehydrogenase